MSIRNHIAAIVFMLSIGMGFTQYAKDMIMLIVCSEYTEQYTYSMEEAETSGEKEKSEVEDDSAQEQLLHHPWIISVRIPKLLILHPITIETQHTSVFLECIKPPPQINVG